MIADVYVDGSYDKYRSPNITKGGVVLLDSTEYPTLVSVRHVYSENREFTLMQSAGGEIIAAIVGITEAFMYCAPHGKGVVNVYYDNQGIEKFITGAFKPTKEGNRYYIVVVNRLKEKYPDITLRFHKVVAHSGNKYNELADQMAKGDTPYDVKDKELPVICV